MGNAMRRAILALVVVGVLLIGGHAAFAADSDLVRVKYDNAKADVATLSQGARCATDQSYTLEKFPSEINGLMFTREPWGGHGSAITIDAESGATVYFIVGNGPFAKQSRSDIESAGWSRIEDAHIKEAHPDSVFWVYKQSLNHTLHLNLPGGGLLGVSVVAKNITLDDQPTKKKEADPTPTSKLHIDPASDDKPIAGPTIQVARQQTSIKSLEILELDSGLMLGQTSEAVLTVTPGDSPKRTSVRFVTKVGDDMCLARDEALRFIRVKYPNWNAASAEITFEDKYTAHDGGSIGTAIGTMMLSVIQGFAIDPDIAITGDISANGKVRSIGGVSAKIRGAIAGKCTLVAIPMENQGQLVDAVTYSGPAMLSDIQIIGLTDLNDAVATVRVDRDPKLAQAIVVYSQLQQQIKADPTYLKKTGAKEKLTQVLELVPQHLSAQLLLAIIDGKQTKSLSFTASMYYTTVAARNMLKVLAERAESHDRQQVPSSVVRNGLTDLHKLMPIADASVRPLINAWIRFIEAWNSLQQGEGSVETLESRRQTLLDEMAKQNTNPDLMQKSLREGF